VVLQQVVLLLLWWGAALRHAVCCWRCCPGVCVAAAVCCGRLLCHLVLQGFIHRHVLQCVGQAPVVHVLGPALLLC
jgi:hypothetical protein